MLYMINNNNLLDDHQMMCLDNDVLNILGGYVKQDNKRELKKFKGKCEKKEFTFRDIDNSIEIQ